MILMRHSLFFHQSTLRFTLPRNTGSGTLISGKVGCVLGVRGARYRVVVVTRYRDSALAMCGLRRHSMRSESLDIRAGSRVHHGCMTSLRISEVAEQTGVPATALRFYEKVGIVVPARTENGYRAYSPSDIARLEFVVRAKTVGLSLDEACELLALRDLDDCAPVQDRLSSLVRSRMADARVRSEEFATFADGTDLGTLGALIAAEWDCCSFFEFRLLLSDDPLSSRSVASGPERCPQGAHNRAEAEWPVGGFGRRAYRRYRADLFGR
jgi:DNA-binding transcriptional MerR regulator